MVGEHTQYYLTSLNWSRFVRGSSYGLSGSVFLEHCCQVESEGCRSVVLLSSLVSLLIFFLVLSVVERMVLKFPIRIVDFQSFSFSSIGFYFT